MAPSTPVNPLPAPNSVEWFKKDPDYVRRNHPDHLLEGKLLIYASLSAKSSGMRKDKMTRRGTQEEESNNDSIKRLTRTMKQVCIQDELNPLVIRACFDEMKSRVVEYYKGGRKQALDEAANKVPWAHRLSGPMDLPDEPTMAQLQGKSQDNAAQNWYVEMAKLCKTYPNDKDGFKQLARDWNHENVESTRQRKKNILAIAKAIEAGGVKYIVDNVAAEVNRLFPDDAWTTDDQFLADLFPSGTALPTRPAAQTKPKDVQKAKANESGPVSNTGKESTGAGGEQQQTLAPFPALGSSNAVKRKHSEPQAGPSKSYKRVKTVDRGASAYSRDETTGEFTESDGYTGVDLSPLASGGRLQPPQASTAVGRSQSSKYGMRQETSAGGRPACKVPISLKAASSFTSTAGHLQSGDDTYTPGESAAPTSLLGKLSSSKVQKKSVATATEQMYAPSGMLRADDPEGHTAIFALQDIKTRLLNEKGDALLVSGQSLFATFDPTRDVFKGLQETFATKHTFLRFCSITIDIFYDAQKGEIHINGITAGTGNEGPIVVTPKFVDKWVARIIEKFFKGPMLPGTFITFLMDGIMEMDGPVEA